MNPAERQPLPGWESRVPRAPDEFARQWRESLERMVLMREIEEYESCYPLEGGERLGAFRMNRKATQAKHIYVPLPPSFLEMLTSE